MRKLIALLMALMLCAMPFAGVAEEENSWIDALVDALNAEEAQNYLQNAIAAGRRVTTTISVEDIADTFIGEPAIDHVIADLLGALQITTYEQDDEIAFALSMKQATGRISDLFSFAVAADNEGIETKLHMTVNGGILNINSTDDSLNAGEDGVSVITINGGRLLCNANNGLEGDGIDSNGWLVINGGSVSAFSSEKSMDSGLDSDNGIIINGGTVYATGTMYDRVSPESRQNTAVFSMDEWVFNEEYVVLKNSADETVAAFKSPSDHRTMIYSSPALTEGDYTFYKAGEVEGENINGVCTQVTEISGMVQLGHTDRGTFPGAGPGRPDRPESGSIKPEIPEFKKPEEWKKHEGGERPQSEDFSGDENMPPEFDSERPEIDKNGRPVGFGGENDFNFDTASLSGTFTVGKGFGIFSSVRMLPED